jgi:hypothetical protein
MLVLIFTLSLKPLLEGEGNLAVFNSGKSPLLLGEDLAEMKN